MAVTAIYTPEGRELDLSALSPADYAMISGLRGLIHHGDGILLCKRATGDREMYIRKVGGKYFASHFKGGAHGEHPITRMSDEHLRGTDCWLTAWSDAGYTTATEVTTGNRTRLDAVAFGPKITALEVQATPESAAVVRRRDAKRRNAKSFTGKYSRVLTAPLEVVWFSPSGRPDWLYQVPTIQCRNRSWNVTPNPWEIPAVGIRVIDIHPCSPAFFSSCPLTGSGWCGARHPLDAPTEAGSQRLSIAHAAAMIPAGELVTVTISGRGIYYTDPASLERYQDFAASAESRRAASRSDRSRAGRAGRGRHNPCEWSGHAAAAPEQERENGAFASRPEPPEQPDFGPWVACVRCGEPYRPANPSGRCHICLYPRTFTTP